MIKEKTETKALEFWRKSNKAIIIPALFFFFFVGCVSFRDALHQLHVFYNGEPVEVTVVSNNYKDANNFSRYSRKSPEAEIDFFYKGEDFRTQDQITFHDASYKNVKQGDIITVIKLEDTFVSPSAHENIFRVVVFLLIILFPGYLLYRYFFFYRKFLRDEQTRGDE